MPSPSSNAYAQSSVQNKHPNIVLFLVDNEPDKALGTYGSGLGAETPNADKFAKEGIKLLNFGKMNFMT